MKKTLKNYLAIVICLISLTGCIRLDDEMDLLSRGRSNLPPPTSKRFYSGSKACTALMIYLWPYAPIILLVLPFELIADTLCLPHDIWLYHEFKKNPPLALLISEQRYDELEKRLKTGEKPDFFDWRMDDLPMDMALRNQDVKAYSLLLKYGAIPDKKSFSYSHLPTKENKEIIRLALEKSPAKYDVILDWCRTTLKNRRDLSESEQQVFIDIIELMVIHGFPFQSSYSTYPQLETVLDMVHNDKTVLSAEKRQRLIDILKAYGGKTYMELSQTDKSLPHLHTENLDIHPIFNSLIKRLAKSWQSEQYRLSTTYDGIHSPLLVIDYPTDYFDNDRKTLESRRTVSVHRRLNATEWNPEGEPFDIPTGWRMIATPKGKRIPSRLSADMPRFVLRESWMTFSDCEVYLESPGEMFDNDSYKIQEILMLDETPSGRRPLRPYDADARDEAYYMHRDMRKWTSNLTNTDEEWLSSLNKATSTVGFPGQWCRCVFHENGAGELYAYDALGRFSQKTNEHPEIIPKPDEIICVFYTGRNKTDKSNNRTVMTSKACYSYWNYRMFNASGFEIFVFFGDEVPQEQLDKLQSAIETLMEKQ